MSSFSTVRLRLPAIYLARRALSTTVPPLPALPLQPPSVEEEAAELEARTKDMAEFFASPRFANIKRPYTPASVASKQGSLPVIPLPSTLLADKLFSILGKAAEDGKPIHTMGAIDPVQMTQMAKNQQVVYISGWVASSVLTTGNNEVGPDFG
jgi:isocitrate lyase